jgi:hypothetical protein
VAVPVGLDLTGTSWQAASATEAGTRNQRLATDSVATARARPLLILGTSNADSPTASWCQKEA